MHQAREGAQAIRLRDGRVLVAGGEDCISRVLASTEIYDPTTGRWTRTGRLHVGRSYEAIVRLSQGRVMIVGGGRSVEIYHPSVGKWTLTDPLPEPRSPYLGELAARLHNGDILVAGGYSSATGALASALRYDLTSGTWRAAGRLSQPRATSLFTLPNGQVLAIGGFDGGRASARVDLYMPRVNKWRTAPSLPQRRSFMRVTSCDGYPLVIGGLGYGYHPRATVYRYQPATGRWAVDTSMPRRLVRFGAVTLRDGTTLVAGGTTEGPGSSAPDPALARALRYYPSR